MQRRGLSLSFISAVFGIFLMNFVSAQFYGGFGLSNILDSIDPSTMILGLIFIIAFALLNYSLSRVFRDNKAIGSIIAFAVSIGIIYGINRTGLDFEGFFYGIGFSSGILYTIIPFLLIAGIIFLVIRFSFGAMFATVGGFLLLVSFTDLVYEKGFIIVIGTILLLIGLWMKHKKKYGLGNNYSYPQKNRGIFSKGVNRYKQGRDYLNTRQQTKLEKEQTRYGGEAAERKAREDRGNLRKQEMERQVDEKRRIAKNIKDSGIWAQQKAQQTQQKWRDRQERKSIEKEDKKYSKDRARAEKENKKRARKEKAEKYEQEWAEREGRN